MDSLHFCIAVTPVGVYFLFLAWINWGRRSRVYCGVRDLGMLALGGAGLAIVGPLELFLPESTAFRLGPYAWLLMIGLYGMGALLVVLSVRPRLVVYNTTIDELTPHLSKIVQEMDPQSRWVGHGIVLPTRGIQMHMEESSSMRNVQLIATGGEQDHSSWSALRSRLCTALGKKDAAVVRNPNAAVFLLMGLMLLAVVIKSVMLEHELMASSLHEMLRI